MRKNPGADKGIAGLAIMLFLLATLSTPETSYSLGSFGTTPEEPAPTLVPTTCSQPKLAGQPQFLNSPNGAAKYPFNGICTSPERPGAELKYRLEASWTPTETDPNKPNASESVEITGFEPFIPVRAPGGRIFMYWTARCKQDPWLQPEGNNCRFFGAFIPEDLRVVVPELQTLNFPKTENMIAPADRQRLHAQYLRVNSPVAGTKRIPGVLGQTDDMFTITNPIRNAVVQQGQLFLKADPPKSGATQVTELEFRWLDAPQNQPYINIFAVETPKLLQGYHVDQAVTRGNAGRWEVRARTSGKAVPGSWSFPVQFKLFITQPTQSQKQASPMQQTAPLPSSAVTPASPVQQTAPLPPSSVIQAPPPSSATTQMKRSSPMVMPRGVGKNDGNQGTQTMDEPAKTEKKP